MNPKRRFPEQNLTDMRNLMISAGAKAVDEKNRSGWVAKRYGVPAAIIWLLVIGFICTADFCVLSGGMHGKFSPPSQLETNTQAYDEVNASPRTAILRNEPIYRMTLADKGSAIPNARLQNEAKQGENRDNPLHSNGLRRLTILSGLAEPAATVPEIPAICSQMKTGSVARARPARRPHIPQSSRRDTLNSSQFLSSEFDELSLLRRSLYSKRLRRPLVFDPP